MMRAFLCLFLFALSSNAAERPNVVFILTDDLGVFDLGCYGRKEHNTPHLDALAQSGIRFTSAYASCPVCSPTRAALMTGKTPAQLHLTTFLPGRRDCVSQKLLHPTIQQSLSTDETTIAEYLSKMGYATGCFGKWHLGGKGSQPKDHGFDVAYAGKANTTPSNSEGGKGEYDLTRKAIEFIKEKKEKPFFLYLAHYTPHIPFTARPDLIEKNQKALEPTYAGVIEAMDDTVGLLLAALEEQKLADNTIVIFSSDNGGLHVPELRHVTITHCGPFRAGKGYLYEGGIRVPLIVRWPGHVPSGRTVDTPVITHDWLPTLLDLANGPTPADVEGVSIRSLLTGTPANLDERPLFWHVPHYTNQGSQPGGAIRKGPWKLIEHYEDGRLELFNLAQDPGEQQSVLESHREVAADLHDRFKQWRSKVGAQLNTANPAFQSDRHRELYIDVEPSRYSAARATPEEIERMKVWRSRMDAVVPQAKKKK